MVRVVLVSTYDLGRQPFGLASPAAWLRRAGVETTCVDTSRDRLTDEDVLAASVIAFYLPMHTATRLALPLIERARRLNPSALLWAYGLYAPLNAEWLRDRGVTQILGPEAEADLVELVRSEFSTPEVPFPTPGAQRPTPKRPCRPADSGSLFQPRVARLQFIKPDRGGLPALERYAALETSDGHRRVAGNTEASRGCKHVCRHCPVVPVYRGQFRIVPVDIVLADIRAQVESGAQHISFGDPDFFNGPTHAQRIVERVAAEFPGLTYDATIKIEHLLKQRRMLPVLRETGCLFVTSAVESIDDEVLRKLRKGHTRADFVEVVAACRAAGVALNPTLVPFTPWTTLDGYVALLDELHALAMQDAVAPVQLAIRLLVTATSPLLELPDVASATAGFDPASLTWPWHHDDRRVDELQTDVMRLVAATSGHPRPPVFAAIRELAYAYAGHAPPLQEARPDNLPTPRLDEPWYCCAEPVDAGV